jgi:hypothetical protein
MVLALPAPPRPFVPGVCHICGRILDDGPNAAAPLNKAEHIAPAAASDPGVCIHCERILCTNPALLSELGDLLAFLPESKPRQPVSHATQASLVIVDSRREVHLPPLSTVYLGRRDENRKFYPHIDLAYDGAVAYGVSRRHARIHLSDSGMQIEDLGSTNGTFVNGYRLSPSKLYPLNYGDVLHLGKLRLVVTLSSNK